METVAEFDFLIKYVEGSTNILADALSQIYGNDAARTVCAPSEYTQHNEDHPVPDHKDLQLSMPVYAGLEASAITCSKSGNHPTWMKDTKHMHQHWWNMLKQTTDLPDGQVEGEGGGGVPVVI